MASTSEAYGDPLEHPQQETLLGQRQPERRARAATTRAKRFAEMVTFVYWRSLGWTRGSSASSTPTGPHSDPDDGRIVPHFVSQALRGEPITCTATASRRARSATSPTWSTGIHAGDVPAAARPARCSTSATRTSGRVREFAEIVNRLCGGRSEIVYEPQPRADDPMRRCPDITKARARARLAADACRSRRGWRGRSPGSASGSAWSRLRRPRRGAATARRRAPAHACGPSVCPFACPLAPRPPTVIEAGAQPGALRARLRAADQRGRRHAAPDADVDEAELAQRGRLEHVAAVDEDRRAHQVAQARQVELAELVPLGHDHQRVGQRRDGVGVRAEQHLGHLPGGVLHRDRVVGDDAAPFVRQQRGSGRSPARRAGRRCSA